jgi:hypothetical protein
MTEPAPLVERNKFLEGLVTNGDFADALFFAWGLTEVLMDDVLLKEYKLSGLDYRADLVLEIDFERKLQLQKKVGLLSKEEFKKVHQFQVRRNSLFHKDGLWLTHISKTEKEELAEVAIKAAQVMETLESRASHPRFKEVNWLRLQEPMLNKKTTSR